MPVIHFLLFSFHRHTHLVLCCFSFVFIFFSIGNFFWELESIIRAFGKFFISFFIWCSCINAFIDGKLRADVMDNRAIYNKLSSHNPINNDGITCFVHIAKIIARGRDNWQQLLKRHKITSNFILSFFDYFVWISTCSIP